MWLSPSGQVAHTTLDWRLCRTRIFINSDISVNLTNSSAIFKSKTSSVTGNTAKGSATVFYHGSDRTMYVSMSCDIYGNVH